MLQVVQMVGALIVLAAFVGNQRFGLATDSVWFLTGNLVGSAVLAVVAGVNGDLGFLLLETVWAIVSAASLWRLLRTPPPELPRTAHP